MGQHRDHHRPLSGGLLCLCKRDIDPPSVSPEAGTLGAVATKNGTNKKVLVTNLHVVAGVDIVNGKKRLRNLRGGEEMYQNSIHNEMHKIGISPQPVKLSLDEENEVDACYLELINEVCYEPASFGLHSHPHGEKRIVGSADAVYKDKVEIWSMRSQGVYSGSVVSTAFSGETDGYRFRNLILVQHPGVRRPFVGDSGSAVVRRIGESNQYHILGLAFAGDAASGVTWVCKARVIERELGITFGGTDTAPYVEAMATAAPETAAIGDTIRLIGSGSCAETYQWQQIGGPTFTLDPAKQQDTEFTVIDGGDEPFRFRLTVRGPGGLEDSAEVNINRKPIANAGENSQVNVGEEINLNSENSRDPDGDTITRSWNQLDADGNRLNTDENIVPEGQRTAVSPRFNAPMEPGTLAFELTVTDVHGATATSTVEVGVVQPPPPPASPSADAGSNQSVGYGDRVDLNGIGSTPVGKLRFSWSESSSHGIILESADTAYPYFTAPETYAVITLQLTVTHTESSETSTASVTITVGSPPPNDGQQDPPSGGDTSNGDTSGDTSGGDTSGGDTSGGDTSGGDTSGGDTSGGDTSGGDTSGGDTSGGDTSGGDTSGGDTSGGDTSGGDTSGGDTSDGDTSSDMSGGQQNPPPVSPSADAGSDQSVDYGERVDLNGIGSTPVGKLRFSWSESSSHGIILESADTAYPYFTAPETYAVITVQLTVTHTESSETATDSVTITVGLPPPPPPAPTADAGSDQSVGGNVTVTLDGSGSSGGTGTLSYSWAETTGHNITLTGADTASPSFTSPGSAAIVAVQLTVTDSAGRTATDSVTIKVTAPPPPPPPGEWSDWASTGVYKNENGRRWRQEMRHDINDLSITEERWVDIGALSWGEWTFVRYEGSGASRMRVEQRTTTYSSHNTSETREIPDPEEIWGPWTPTGNHQGCGPDRQAEQSRTSNYQNTETQFVADPEPKTWSEWMDTGEDRGCGSGREAEQSRISHCGDSETRWVSSPEALRWSNWSNTGSYRGCGQDREARQSRTSQCGDTQTQWVDSPEALRWSNWGNTGSYRGCGPDREARQSRTSQCGDTQTRWADSPVPEEFGDWSDTTETRGATPCVQEKKQTRTGDCGSVQTRWVDDPQPETWGEWEDTGEVSGILDARSKKQKRTSDCNNTEYQWVPVMTEWGPWERTGDYQGCGPNRKAKEERISNFGDVDVQWVPAPEPDPPGPWSDTGNHRGCGPDREKEQTRTYKCGRTETQWVAAAEALMWGEWKNLNEYRISPDDELIRQRKQERTDQCGNKETRWVYYEPLDQSPVWSVWSDTGKTRGATPCVQKKEQQRTSDQGETQTRWVDDPQPEKWGNWIDTGEYRENPDTFITEYEQKRTSNCGNVEYRWSE